MVEQPDAFWYCLSCGAENEAAAQFCHDCGAALHEQRGHDRQGVAFLLNELHALHAAGAFGDQTFLRLRERYREVLRQLGAEAAPQPVAALEARPEREPAGVERTAAQPAGPGWLAEQQANLLLYLGAFLFVIAALIFVSASADTISDGLRMALVVVGTLIFLAAGVFCLRIPRVQQAGIVFFGVGALTVPLNFAAAYAFFLADDDIDGTSLWLAGSLTSTLFYAAVSWLRMGRWYPVPMAAALGSSLAALLTLFDSPPEVYPASFIGLAFVFAAPALLRLGRIDDVFGLIGSWAAHLVVPLAFIASLAMIESEGVSGALAAALAAAVFYAVVSWRGMGHWDPVPRKFYSAPLALALLSSLGLALAVGDAPEEVYPGSFIALALALAAASMLPAGRIRDTFGLNGGLAANAVVPPAMVAALVFTVAGDPGGDGRHQHRGWVQRRAAGHIRPDAVYCVYHLAVALVVVHPALGHASLMKFSDAFGSYVKRIDQLFRDLAVSGRYRSLRHFQVLDISAVQLAGKVPDGGVALIPYSFQDVPDYFGRSHWPAEDLPDALLDVMGHVVEVEASACQQGLLGLLETLDYLHGR